MGTNVETGAAGAPPKPLLSRDEMNSLLDSGPRDGGAGAVPLPLGSPAPLSRDEEQAWEGRLREAGRRLGERLSALLRKQVTAEVAAPRRRRFADLAAGISEVTAAALGPGSAPGSAGLALTLPLGGALRAVDLLLGGQGASREEISAAPTPLERALILEIGSAIASALATADRSSPSRWTVETLVVDRAAAPDLAMHETAIVVDLKLDIGEDPLLAAAWIPEEWLAPERAAREGARGGRALDLGDLRATAAARIEVGRLTLGEALSLQPGDLVRLECAPEARLLFNGVPIFAGSLMRDAVPNLFEIGSIIQGESHDGPQSKP